MAKKAEEKAEKKEEKPSHKAGKKPAKEEKKAEHKKEEKAKEKPAKEEKKAEHKKEEKKPAKEEKKAEHKKEEKKPVKKEEKAKEEKKAEHRVEERRPEHRHREPKNKKPSKGKALKGNFVELKPAEIEEAIVHLANEGHSASEIGMILRDQYGIPKTGKVMGKKLSAILKEHKLLHKIPEDLMSLIRKSVALRAHLERNKKDMSAKRGLMLTVSKIRALEKYYKKKGKLPMQWRYSPETAALLAK